MQSILNQSLLETYDNLRGKKYRFNQQRPYMKYREQDIFEEVLTNLKPKKCLEWGSGHSTLYFPQTYHPELWVSIENNQEWFNRINESLTAKNVKLLWIQMHHFPIQKDNVAGTYLDDMKLYLDAADPYAKFDFIMIDGRSRVLCLEKAQDLIHENGVIALHDANRAFYRHNLPQFSYQVLFNDFRRNAGGLWLGSPGRPIQEVLEVEKHQNKWKLLKNKFAKILNI